MLWTCCPVQSRVHLCVRGSVTARLLSHGRYALTTRVAGPWCPPFKLYSAGHHLPLLEDMGCPGELPCPCAGEQQRCFALEAGTLDIPAGNTTVVQVRGSTWTGVCKAMTAQLRCIRGQRQLRSSHAHMHALACHSVHTA